MGGGDVSIIFSLTSLKEKYTIKWTNKYEKGDTSDTPFYEDKSISHFEM